MFSLFFFFNDTATTEIYTLPLHDALPIYLRTNVPNVYAIGDVTGKQLLAHLASHQGIVAAENIAGHDKPMEDRKSTRLNSSHANISYAVFCLKKKINIIHTHMHNTCTIMI